MATACNVTGIVGVRDARPYEYSAGKNYWKYDGFLPLTTGVLAVDFFTFGRDTTPLDDGVYSGAARVVVKTTAGTNSDATHGQPLLQLFASDEFHPLPSVEGEGEARMPPPVFVIVGKVSRSNLESEHRRAFDVDVSQYGTAPQQFIRLRCYYPPLNNRFAKTPLPSVSKHVVVYGLLTGFHGGRCLICVNDIFFGPADTFSDSTDCSTA